jgi:hypothetical protein
MLKVFFTVDTEIWCGGWDDLDRKFPAAFQQYVYGPTDQGNYALPMTMEILSDHGLKGVFFVEPLFATRFGLSPLQEMVEMIQEAGHEVQLHLHTEWVDEAQQDGTLPAIDRKRENIREFSRPDQSTLIGKGLSLLRSAGAEPINAFRAGNYGLNAATLVALAENRIDFDTSYNAAAEIGVDDVAPGEILTQPRQFDTVIEYPVTVYRDRGGDSLRLFQLNACSFNEMTIILTTAMELGWESIVIVSHNFELLNQRKNRPDSIVVRRFRKLCRYLETNSDRFEVTGFTGLQKSVERPQPPLFSSSKWDTYARSAEQIVRRAFG